MKCNLERSSQNAKIARFEVSGGLKLKTLSSKKEIEDIFLWNNDFRIDQKRQNSTSATNS